MATKPITIGSRGPRRRLLLVVGCVAATAVLAASAWAYWTAIFAAGTAGAAAAATVNGGATPTVSLTAVGREVTLSWGASTLSNGVPVSGYVVKRYPAGGGASDLSPVGTCSGTVAGTTCSEEDVPPGIWRYSVTPVVGSWSGSESLVSGTITIGAAALTVNGSPFGSGAFSGGFANATGSISGFAGYGSGGHGEGVAYRLDSGTSMTGSPAFVGTTGNATITSLAIPSSAGNGAHTVYALGDATYHPSQASTGIVIDTAAPAVTATLSPAPNAAGWNNTAPVGVTLAANDGTGTGIAQIKYTTDGSDPVSSPTAQVYLGSPFNVSSQGTTTVKFVATDAAGNTSAVQTQLVKIDTAPPTNSPTLNVSSGNALLNGTTVWYRGVNSGAFTLTNAVSDALSGAASSATAALSGTTSGWSHTSSSVSTPSGGPYVSNAFAWNAGTTSAPSESITGRDVADNFATTSLSFSNDSTGPSGGSVDAAGLVGTGSRYSTTTMLSISFSTGSDSGVGLATSGALLQREQGTLASSDGLADGTCSYGAGYSTIATDPTSPYTDSVGISGGHCYRYRYVVADKLGNATTYTSGDVKIDTTDPATPTPSLSAATGNTYVNGTTAYINPQAGKSGTFQVAAATTDGEAGIKKVTFPTLTGFSSGGGDSVFTPFSTTYTWSGAVGATGSQTVTATSNATRTSSGTFTIAADTTAPTGGALTANGTAASSGGSSSYNSTGSFTIARTDYTDSGSGLAASTLTRETAPLTSSDGIAAGGCGTFAGSSTITGTPTQNAAAGIASGNCYRYTLAGTDNVGNTVNVVTIVKVDTTAPLAPSISLSSASGNTYISGSTVYINAQAGKSGGFAASATTTDSDSGIAKVNFPAPSGFSSGGGDVSSSPFQTTYGWSGAVAASGSQAVTAYDNAALTSTGSFTVTPDTTAPTGGVLTVNGVAATTGGSSSYSGSGSFSISARTNYTDSGSGLASSLLTRQSASLSSSDGVAGGSCGTFGSATTINGSAPISQTLTGPTCYLYTLAGTDNVGNTAAVSTIVKVDTSAPSTPSVSLSNASGDTYVSGSTVYINAQAGKSGSFRAAATTTDSDSGILKVNFPALTGFTSGAGDVSSSPFQTTYSWSGAVGASGSQTVTASNNASLTSTGSFTVASDTAAPTGGLLTVNSTAATSAGSSSTTSNPNFTILRTDYSDGGSGLASSTLTVQSETLTTNSTCGAAGSGGPYTSPTTISGTTNAAITVGYCYVYTLTGTDNVGNAASIKTTVKVPFAGITWTASNKSPTCVYTNPAAVTCTVTGVGNGGTFTAKVMLIDGNQAAVNNTTGSAITVSASATSGTVAPASSTIATSASATAASFSLTLPSGATKTSTVTASITVGGTTYTVNCLVSST